MNKKKTRVTCITCPKCGETIYSRAQHDYRPCSCDSIFIDGGREYVRIGWHPDLKKAPKTFYKFINGVTRQDLYDDWNNRINKYGKIC